MASFDEENSPNPDNNFSAPDFEDSRDKDEGETKAPQQTSENLIESSEEDSHDLVEQKQADSISDKSTSDQQTQTNELSAKDSSEIQAPVEQESDIEATADQTQVKSFGSQTENIGDSKPSDFDTQSSTNQQSTSTVLQKPKKKINFKKIGLSLGIAVLIIVVASLFTYLFVHDWAEATCTEPETCTICHKTRDEALGHEWTPATCTEPSTCSRCGATRGSELGHDWEEWTVEEESTCTV